MTADPHPQDLVRELAVALGYDLPALPFTPAEVWRRLIEDVERLNGEVSRPWSSRFGWRP